MVAVWRQARGERGGSGGNPGLGILRHSLNCRTSAVTNLDTLLPGTRARLISIAGERSFRCRLMELGLLPGTYLRLVRRVDVGGVLELEVRGCRLSVRRAEARQLCVEPS